MFLLDVVICVLVAVKIANGRTLTPLAHKFVREGKAVATSVQLFATMAVAPLVSCLARNLASMVTARGLVALPAIHVSSCAVGHANIKASVQQCVASLVVASRATNHVLNYYLAVIYARVYVVSIAPKFAYTAA